MDAWATADQLRAKLVIYATSPTEDNILSGFADDTARDAYLLAKTTEATGLLVAAIGGKAKITDAAACGMDQVCLNLAAALVIQEVYQSRMSPLAEDAGIYEARAMQFLNRFLASDIEDLINMPGVDPPQEAAPADRVTLSVSGMLPRRFPDRNPRAGMPR